MTSTKFATLVERGRAIRKRREESAGKRRQLSMLQARKAGQVFKLRDDGGLAVVAESAPRVDYDSRSVTLTICTPAIDCQNEIVLASGISLERFKANPVCLFDHSFGSIDIPIGRWEDSDGNLTLKLRGDVMTGTAYIAQGFREADAVWAMIEQGVLRGASVQVLPKVMEFRTINGEQVRVIVESELLEVSLTAQPCNPQATRKAAESCGCNCKR